MRRAARSARAQSHGDHPHPLCRERQRCRREVQRLADYGLDEFYWQGAQSIYGYTSPSPSIDDFVLWVFRQAIAGFKSERPGGLRNIQLDFASLRNDRRSEEALTTLAKRVARDLDYASTIEDASFRDLLGNDLFEEVNRKIISDLARAVADRTITAREVTEVIRARQSSIWIDGYRRLYAAIGSASDLLTALGALEPLDAVVREAWTATGMTGSASTSSTGSSPTRPAPPSSRPAGGAARSG